MIEDELHRRHIYRRTRNLIDTWTAPEGIDVGVIGHHVERQVDVVMKANGLVERIRNVHFQSKETCHAVLDRLAHMLMARCIAAYEAHEIVEEGVVYKMEMAKAGRKFDEFIESTACRGKGGDDE